METRYPITILLVTAAVKSRGNHKVRHPRCVYNKLDWSVYTRKENSRILVPTQPILHNMRDLIPTPHFTSPLYTTHRSEVYLLTNFFHLST